MLQGIPGSGVGPGGGKAPAYDSDPAPGGTSARQNFFGPAPGGAKAPAKDSYPAPGGAKAPAKDSDPAPGGALTPAEDSDPAPGGAKAPAAPDLSLRFLTMCNFFFKCSPHLTGEKTSIFIFFPNRKRVNIGKITKKAQRAWTHGILLQVACEIKAQITI